MPDKVATRYGWYAGVVMKGLQIGVFARVALLAAVAATGCKKEEQAVEGVARSAQEAEQKAQAANTERDQQRAELGKIPLPTKSLYVNVHDPAEWQNPFISADAEFLDLRVMMADANTSHVGEGTMLRPAAARRQEIQVRPGDLATALIALPEGAWHYGRVVAIAESPIHDRKKQAAVRRNVEEAIRRLNDLGVVVEEWPTR